MNVRSKERQLSQQSQKRSVFFRGEQRRAPPSQAPAPETHPPPCPNLRASHRVELGSRGRERREGQALCRSPPPPPSPSRVLATHAHVRLLHPFSHTHLRHHIQTDRTLTATGGSLRVLSLALAFGLHISSPAALGPDSTSRVHPPLSTLSRVCSCGHHGGPATPRQADHDPTDRELMS